MKKVIFICSILSALSAASASAQQPEVSFKVGKPKAIILATPFQLDFEVAVKDNCGVSIDTATQNSEAFEIAALTQEKQTQGSTHKFSLTVIPFELGVSTFPALAWKLSCGNTAMEVKSPEMPFDVAPFSTPTAGGGEIIEIRPQYAPYYVPWWLWALLLAAAVILYYALRKRREKLRPELEEDLRPPHIRALDEIEKLLLSQIWEDGRYMEFYIRISAILRDYLERRFGLSADKLTTADLHRALLNGPVDKLAAGAIRSFLAECDLVKFAKYVPDSAYKDKSVSKLREIISQTAPPTEPLQGQEGKR